MPLRGEIFFEGLSLILVFNIWEVKIMLTITYLYTLKLNNSYLSIYSEDSTMSVLKEYPGAQLVSKNEVGYKMVMAD
jgi:hypothetical protein